MTTAGWPPPSGGGSDLLTLLLQAARLVVRQTAAVVRKLAGAYQRAMENELSELAETRQRRIDEQQRVRETDFQERRNQQEEQSR